MASSLHKNPRLKTLYNLCQKKTEVYILTCEVYMHDGVIETVVKCTHTHTL